MIKPRKNSFVRKVKVVNLIISLFTGRQNKLSKWEPGKDYELATQLLNWSDFCTTFIVSLRLRGSWIWIERNEAHKKWSNESIKVHFARFESGTHSFQSGQFLHTNLGYTGGMPLREWVKTRSQSNLMLFAKCMVKLQSSFSPSLLSFAESLPDEFVE